MSEVVAVGEMVIVYDWDCDAGVTAGAVATVEAPPQPATEKSVAARMAAIVAEADRDSVAGDGWWTAWTRRARRGAFLRNSAAHRMNKQI